MECCSGRAAGISLCIVILLACLSGCSKEAVFLTDKFDNAGRFGDTTLVATDSDWSNRGQSAGPGYLSKRLVVDSWKGYLARTFIGFTSLPDSGVEITSATLQLYGARLLLEKDLHLAGLCMASHICQGLLKYAKNGC